MKETNPQDVLNAIGEETDIGELIGFYVGFRDELEEIKRRMAEEQANPTSYMKRIETRLLELMLESGQESAKTKYGTAYKVPKMSATVADKNVFMNYVKANDAFDLLTAAVSKDAVKARMEETGEPIPGINISTVVAVNVRRS